MNDHSYMPCPTLCCQAFFPTAGRNTTQEKPSPLSRHSPHPAFPSAGHLDRRINRYTFTPPGAPYREP